MSDVYIMEVHQHGGSIILCGTFRRISQLWDSAQTLNLVNCLLCLSPLISHFPDFIYFIVFDYIFLLRDGSENLLLVYSVTPFCDEQRVFRLYFSWTWGRLSETLRALLQRFFFLKTYRKSIAGLQCHAILVVNKWYLGCILAEPEEGCQRR